MVAARGVTFVHSQPERSYTERGIQVVKHFYAIHSVTTSTHPTPNSTLLAGVLSGLASTHLIASEERPGRDGLAGRLISLQIPDADVKRELNDEVFGRFLL